MALNPVPNQTHRFNVDTENTINLPAASSGEWVRLVTITESMTNVTIVPNGTDTIEGQAGPSVIQWPQAALLLIMGPSNDWFVAGAVRPGPPRYDATFKNWTPAGGTIGTPFQDINLTVEGIKYMNSIPPFGIVATLEGVYWYGISGALTHKKEQLDREFELRIWNQTDSVMVGNVLSVYSEQQERKTSFSNLGHFDVPETLLGKEMRLQIGNATISGGGPTTYDDAEMMVGSFSLHGIDVSYREQSA